LRLPPLFHRPSVASAGAVASSWALHVMQNAS
jgi:hypothetical protein